MWAPPGGLMPEGPMPQRPMEGPLEWPPEQAMMRRRARAALAPIDSDPVGSAPTPARTPAWRTKEETDRNADPCDTLYSAAYGQSEAYGQSNANGDPNRRPSTGRRFTTVHNPPAKLCHKPRARAMTLHMLPHPAPALSGRYRPLLLQID